MARRAVSESTREGRRKKGEAAAATRAKQSRAPPRDLRYKAAQPAAKVPHMRRNPATFAILVGGGIAGALDIAYAIGFSAWRGIPAERLLQLVASGLLGASAYDGGAATALLGLALHFLISLAAAAVFYIVASRYLHGLMRHAVASGVLFGLAVFAVMNFVVLPLSAFPHEVRFTPLATGTNLASHMFLFGVPIALATRRALGR